MKYLLSLLFCISLLSCEKNAEEPTNDIDKTLANCGCTDEKADNYSTLAICDDGSCLYKDDELKTLNILYTSTGCGACGIWGIDCYSTYSKDDMEGAIPFEVHFKYNDPMINAISDSFVTLGKPNFSPFFAIGLTKSTVLADTRPETCEQSSDNADKLIAEFKENTLPFQSAVQQKIDGDSIIIWASVDKVQQEHTRIAAFILEDDLIYTQNAGWKNDIEDWVHNNVLRASATYVKGEAFEGNADKRWSIAIDENWNPEKLKTVLVIWQENNGEFKILNAKLTK